MEVSITFNLHREGTELGVIHKRLIIDDSFSDALASEELNNGIDTREREREGREE